MSSEWQNVTVDQVAEVKSGKRLPLGDALVEEPTPFPYIRLVDVVNGRIRRGNLKFLTAETRSRIRRYVINTGDVGLAIVGNTIGLVFYADSEWDDTNLTENAARITNFSECINSKYLYYYLTSPDGQAEIRSRTIGSAQGKLPLYNIKSLSLFIPPRAEQDRVVSILDALSSKIDLLRDTNATLEAIAQALFKSWFVDFDPVRAKAEGREPEGLDADTAALFPDGFDESELGLLPRGWSDATLGRVCDEHGGGIQTGPFGSQLHASDYTTFGIPVVMPKDIANRRVTEQSIARIDQTEADRLARHKVQAGDIVFSRRGDVERHALISELEAGWVCGTGCLLVRPGSAWPSPTFLSLALDDQRARSWLVRHAVGATMPNLNTGILADVPILMPQRDVVTAFENIVKFTEEKRTANFECIHVLTGLRDTLLPRLISGQLRLPEAEAMLKDVA